MGMPRQTSGLRRRRTALFAIAVWILMTGGAESDVVERVNDLRVSTSSQELVPPLEGSSTADLQQVVGAPKNHDLGSAGADAVQLQSKGVAEADLVEGVTELGSSMLNQEQLFLPKESSTADLQVLSNKVAGTPRNRVLGSAGADLVQPHSEGVLALNGTNGASTTGSSTPGPMPPGLPSLRAMNERQRELLEAHEVLKAAEFKVVNKCMQRENKRSLTLVKKGLVLFQQQQRKSERGKGFIQLADEIATSVSHLVDLADASGVFSGYADDVSEKDLTVAAEAKALHMDQSAAEISGISPGSRETTRRLMGGIVKKKEKKSLGEAWGRRRKTSRRRRRRRRRRKSSAQSSASSSDSDSED